ncbi:MAG: uncharacterized membrane protein YidH (DUF202 family) [Paracoccaceae bacterium]|jgi:hypothetical protein
MIETFNILAALLTIAFGAFGFLAPRFTMDVLDLKDIRSTMGLSEMRASVGGLFVGLGGLMLVFPAPMVLVTVGVAYAGAALGRIVSLVLDAPPRRKLLLYFAVESGLAAWLILANVPTG